MDLHEIIQSAIGYQKAGNLQQAEKFFKLALDFQPDNVTALHFLGVLYYQLKNYDSAQFYIKKALGIAPTYTDAYNNLGIILKEQGNIDDAITCFKEAFKVNPKHVLSYYNLGNILREMGQLDEAIKFYQKAIDLDPNLAEAHHGLGYALQEMGQLDEAIKFYQKAIMLNPGLAETYCNLSNILQEKGYFDEAVTCSQKALQLSPASAIAHYTLGDAFKKQGKLAEALQAYDKAIECNPDFVIARFARCFSQLPVIYANQTEISDSRERYLNELVNLNHTIPLRTAQDIETASQAMGRQQPFYLAYQGLNDRELQRLYGEMVCKIMSSRYPQFSRCSSVPPGKATDTLRIGIVSGFFYMHSNWKIPMQGWIENIDKERFNLYGYYTGNRKDDVTVFARQHFFRFVEDIYCFEDLCNIIKKDNLHILIYPEIGMDPTTLRLASLKLAPVQCTSWGHPDTSGLPTIDYYLSCDLMEPIDADDHYCEKLVRLPNLSIFYKQQDLPDINADRDRFGLHPNSILYLCPQSLFKYLPQYDEIYPLIARQVKDCQFMFIRYQAGNYVTEQFQLRLSKAFNKFGLNADDYVVFLPRLDPLEYKSVNMLSDVYLDSICWSGCNTTFEAIAYNLPVLTMPGALMRGRHSAAILTMMGMTETVAQSVDDYVKIAVRLGKEADWRKHVSQRISESKHLIYQDRTCITALEDFLEKTVKKGF